VVAFICVPWLGAGDVTAFLFICAASGLALGADLALPSALLAGVVRHAGKAGRAEGEFFGWWACATKLNLAAAAGLALPLLAFLGYASGTREPQALQALSLAYGAVPCALKLMAALALWLARGRHVSLGEQIPLVIGGPS
jgi:Na+/melibiose symporter-like transporter